MFTKITVKNYTHLLRHIQSSVVKGKLRNFPENRFGANRKNGEILTKKSWRRAAFPKLWSTSLQASSIFASSYITVRTVKHFFKFPKIGFKDLQFNNNKHELSKKIVFFCFETQILTEKAFLNICCYLNRKWAFSGMVPNLFIRKSAIPRRTRGLSINFW